MRSVNPATRRPSASLAANASSAGDASVAQRLDALRVTSGALTHDLNNLLGVILSASERLTDDLAEGSEHQKLALLVLEAAERGAELLRRGLALTHDARQDPETVDAAPALQSLRRLARMAVKPGVRLKICPPPQRLVCRGDRTGLEMALLNLCLNADQAMAGPGAITVEAKAIRLEPSDRLRLPAGSYAAFTVRDTGAGMSRETLGRATETLFTTKANGTGLGLSSVLDFATAAGGALSLWSREGQGTTATLYLPLAAPAIRAAA
jgi:signal transduction histidine kinase